MLSVEMEMWRLCEEVVGCCRGNVLVVCVLNGLTSDVCDLYVPASG